MRIGPDSLKYELFLMLFVQKTFIFSFLTDFVDLKCHVAKQFLRFPDFPIQVHTTWPWMPEIAA